jgi:hypothetical protein
MEFHSVSATVRRTRSTSTDELRDDGRTPIFSALNVEKIASRRFLS